MEKPYSKLFCSYWPIFLLISQHIFALYYYRSSPWRSAAFSNRETEKDEGRLTGASWDFKMKRKSERRVARIYWANAVNLCNRKTSLLYILSSSSCNCNNRCAPSLPTLQPPPNKRPENTIMIQLTPLYPFSSLCLRVYVSLKENLRTTNRQKSPYKY